MVETVHDLRSASSDYNDMIFTAKSGSSFFFPLGNLLLCDRKHESDQNPGQTQPKLTQGISPTRTLYASQLFKNDPSWILHIVKVINSMHPITVEITKHWFWLQIVMMFTCT